MYITLQWFLTKTQIGNALIKAKYKNKEFFFGKMLVLSVIIGDNIQIIIII